MSATMELAAYPGYMKKFAQGGTYADGPVIIRGLTRAEAYTARAQFYAYRKAFLKAAEKRGMEGLAGQVVTLKSVSVSMREMGEEGLRLRRSGRDTPDHIWELRYALSSQLDGMHELFEEELGTAAEGTPALAESDAELEAPAEDDECARPGESFDAFLKRIGDREKA